MKDIMKHVKCYIKGEEGNANKKEPVYERTRSEAKGPLLTQMSYGTNKIIQLDVDMTEVVIISNTQLKIKRSQIL